MNPEIKAQWVAALRSGKYAKGIGALRDEGKFCCLGVLCELAVAAGVAMKSERLGSVYYSAPNGDYPERCFLPEPVAQWAGLDSLSPRIRVSHDPLSAPRTLSTINDSTYATFEDIASMIEEQL